MSDKQEELEKLLESYKRVAVAFSSGVDSTYLLKMAQKVFYHDEDYRKFCFENGFVTKHKTPRPQLKAEILYRYITNNTAFEETHKGLEDTSIEKEIFLECIRRNPTVERKLWKD